MTTKVSWSRLGCLELCFKNQMDFSAYGANISIKNMFFVMYTLFVIDLCMITQCLSTLDYPKQQIHKKCTQWRCWLDGARTISQITDDYFSSSFWKGRKTCRHIVKPLTFDNTKQFTFNCRCWREGQQSIHSRLHDSF